MLSVTVHKDMFEYEPKIIGHLTSRTLICCTLGVVVAVATAAYMQLVLGIEAVDHPEAFFATSLPFWAAGFWKPKGLPLEEFAKLWLRHNFTCPSFIPYISRLDMNADAQIHESDEETNNPNNKKKGAVYAKDFQKLTQEKGIESYSPIEHRVIV